jgi:hypothetical protein
MTRQLGSNGFFSGELLHPHHEVASRVGADSASVARAERAIAGIKLCRRFGKAVVWTAVEASLLQVLPGGWDSSAQSNESESDQVKHVWI